MGLFARNIARIARNITRNIHQTYWDLLGIQVILVRLLVISARLLVMLLVILRPIFTGFSDFLGRYYDFSMLLFD